MDKTYHAKVNNTFSFDVDLTATFPDLAVTGPDTFHFLKDHKPAQIKVLHRDFLQKTYTIQVNGIIHIVKISDAIDRLIEEMGFSGSEGDHISEINAPMPGLVLDIQVKAGYPVKENDTLIVLEAMKMENVILSPRDGIIKSVAVQQGSPVDKGQLLLEYE